MKEIITMHGWACDSSIWAPWEQYFRKKGWFWQNNDRGYGILEPNQAEWIHRSTDNIHYKRVVICHSLGSHLIKREVLEKATDIVLISSFGRFITEDRGKRSFQIALAGMKKALGSKYENHMLLKFLEKAYSPYKFKNLPSGLIKQNLSIDGRKKLQSDLDLLINTQGLPIGIPCNSRLLTIFGLKDSILLPSSLIALLNELNNYLQKQPTHWTSSNEGHFILKPALIKRVELWLR
tara:strand:- start:5598 stop:6305 length:708 start_codon:yes stop_codon:yes gene_type:complete